MRVIGTAGHVDHGKSTLVKCLTGMDPDRLIEEKTRKLTIDLGFAWLTLADGESVGVVDVPGHRDFIENMLAGVGGIDATLLVIAADEGVMPQTREHLAILDLLGITNGIVVITRTDMVDDPEWLELVMLEVQDFIQPTALADAPIMPVSAHTGSGIEDLLETLTALLADLPPRRDYNHPRLPVDRVFSISGFGTIVTGTLSGGTLATGDIIEFQPAGVEGRIRGLQTHKQDIEVALPGSRVAVNISGVDTDEISRGDVLAYPGQLLPTDLVDVHFRYLPDVNRPLKHNTEVKFFSGASESVASVRLLNDDQLRPGQTGWLQLRLQTPVSLTQGDRFILRYPSPAETIGGGLIVNPHPGKRWRRFQQDVIIDLQTRLSGSPAERIARAAEGTQTVKRYHLQEATGYSGDELEQALLAALDEQRIVRLAQDTFLGAASLESLQQQMRDHLRDFHEADPLRVGMSREEMRSRLGIKTALLNALLAMQTEIVVEQDVLRLPEHVVQYTDAQQKAIDRLMAQMRQQPHTPPSYTEAVEITGEAVLRSLIEGGEIVQVQPDVIFLATTYREMVCQILAMLDSHEAITTGQVRDHFQSTRKYIIGLLEHLDSAGITRRAGDDRVRGTRTPDFVDTC